MTTEWIDVKDYEGFYKIRINEDNPWGCDILSLKWHSRYGSIDRESLLNPWINRGGYYQVELRVNKKRSCKYIHILIAEHYIPNPENKKFIDHKDTIRTNNKLDNLRWATKSENERNRNKRLNVSSKYKGVCWDKTKSKWIAYINSKYIGYYDNEIDASKAYDEKAIELFGEYAKTNF